LPPVPALERELSLGQKPPLALEPPPGLELSLELKPMGWPEWERSLGLER
jgi:hypothetical protein